MDVAFQEIQQPKTPKGFGLRVYESLNPKP